MAKAKTPRNGNSPKKQVASVSRVITGPGANNNPTPADLESEIRRRAYELYERRGCAPGHESEDWLVAEREISARHQHQGA
jgi:hypothetical protein